MPPRPKFRHSQLTYARLYGTTRDIIGRIVRDGINPDDASAVKAYLDKRTRTKSVQTPGEPAPRAEKIESNGELPPESERNRVTGLVQGISELKEASAELAEQWRKAMRDRNLDEIRFWGDEWLKAFEQLRRVEQVNPEIERLKRETVRISDVEIFIHRMASEIREAIDAAPERLAHKLVGLPVSDILVEMKRENEVVLRHLSEWPKA